MLFHYVIFHKCALTLEKHGLGRLLPRHVTLASPARQHPFRMFRQPFDGVLLAAHQASLWGQTGERPLFGA